MQTRITSWCLAIAVMLLLMPAQAPAAVLDARWEFRLLPGDAQAPAHPQAAAWHRAQVPGSVHTDLLDHALIPDPYVGAPEASLQWIGLADWEYRATFDVAAETLARPHAELVFEGLDTFAEVELNGQPLLRADNAHRTWIARVEGRLQARSNTLRIVFRSPITTLLPSVQAMPHKIAGNYPSPYGDEPRDAMVGNFVRKPAYHFGWDWGPRYVTAGVWRPVRLETWGAHRIDDLAVRTDRLDADAALLTAQVAVRHEGAAASALLDVDVRDPEGRIVARAQHRALLQPGEQQIDVPLQIDQPRRWWPAGQGAQDRYTVHASLGRDEDPALRAERRIGLRSVELRRQNDADGGQGFAFVINGRGIFAKGANVIPFDAFPARVDTSRLRTILTAARDANMNMLRNWGGGYYEDDAFFDLADELGLLVWQDFMFGGGMQPGYDPAFRQSVVAEARDNVRRLRHHPSIVLWCGNNEEETAWKDWGHGRDLEKADPAFAAKVWQGYVDLFGNDLRRLVAEEALGVPYWSSSPSNDLDTKANDSTRGDKHYWQVWGNPALPVTAYLRETPRFMSEYGLQSWPSQAMVDRIAPRAEQRIDSPVIQAHQKFMAGQGNERLLHYIRLGYGEPGDFAAFLYLGQVMQAEGIQLAALHHRASRPYTMGSLYWQLNDVWPGASWSGLDHDGHWKALHFQARRFFADIAVAALRDDGVTRISLLNDTPTPQRVDWRLRVMALDGREISHRQQAVVLAPGSATEVGRLGDARLLGAEDPARTIAVVELLQDERVVSRQVVSFVEARDQALQADQLQASLQGEGDQLEVVLQARGLVRAAWIDFGPHGVVLEDNLLDLLPGERRVLRVRSDRDAATLRAALRVQTLGDIREVHAAR